MILPSHLRQRLPGPLLQIQPHHLVLELRAETRPLSRHTPGLLSARTLLGPESGKNEARQTSTALDECPTHPRPPPRPPRLLHAPGLERGPRSRPPHPILVIAVSMRYTVKSTLTPSATAFSCEYSMTRFCLKKPKASCCS